MTYADALYRYRSMRDQAAAAIAHAREDENLGRIDREAYDRLAYLLRYNDAHRLATNKANALIAAEALRASAFTLLAPLTDAESRFIRRFLAPPETPPFSHGEDAPAPMPARAVCGNYTAGQTDIPETRTPQR